MEILDVRGEFDAVGPQRNNQEENQLFGASYMHAWKLYKSREI